MKGSIPAFACLLYLVSCSPMPPNVAEVRKAIDAMNEESTKNILAGTMDTTLAHYMDDAVSMPNYGPMLKGKKAIREYYAAMFKDVKITAVNFKTADVNVSGSYAVETGTYAMTLQNAVIGQMNDEGKYLTVYEHAPDGSWKIKAETWNTNKEPMAPPKEEPKGK